MTSIPTLYTFAVSHFSEKARWGLEWAGIAFRERALLPGLHMLTTRRLAPRSSVPILVDKGQVIQGSAAILDHATAHLRDHALSPGGAIAEEVTKLEAMFDRDFGASVQTIAYGELLADRQTTVALWSHASPKFGKAFYALTYPAISRAVWRGYVKRPEHVEKAKHRFRDAMAQTDAMLAGRTYLLGESPSRADLTLAALLAPLIMPPEHLIAWPTPPKGLAQFCDEFVGRATYNHVRRMYREHRKPMHGSSRQPAIQDQNARSEAAK